ncbi:hypothetical protein DPEC_G00072000 [Dallia pectoralis]|uniref:Uncharacterized protein n=1 Tax=Dallia pectoralis TaxID=75939 RepID=A0ACC2H2G8_DALPE|nr:hypothetical protein DPEC_G00072000 [Dallia pectoralis]
MPHVDILYQKLQKKDIDAVFIKRALESFTSSVQTIRLCDRQSEQFLKQPKEAVIGYGSSGKTLAGLENTCHQEQGGKVCWRHPPIATKSKQGNIPLEPARAGAQDGSINDNKVIDPGTDMTMSKNTALETTTTAAEHSLQVCTCGWAKITSFRGLRAHQGKKGCLREQGQGPRIDQYFLRSNQSNQSIEAQQRNKNQSSQSISTPVTEENSTSTEMSVEDPTPPQRPPKERKISGYRPSVKWPKAVEKREWETVNNDLTKILEHQVGTADKWLERVGDIIYHYGEERF